MRQGVNVLYRSEGGAYRRDVEVDEPDSRRRNLRGQELLALCSKCAVMCLRKTGRTWVEGKNNLRRAVVHVWPWPGQILIHIFSFGKFGR